MVKKSFMAALLGLAVVFSSAGCVTVVPIGHEDEVTGNVAFNAADNVAGIWESKAIPDLEKNAVELNQLLKETNGKLKSAADKYGHYTMGKSGELSYIVKGAGTVTEINQEKRAGFMTVKLDGYDGPVVVKLQIGPVYKGSAIRDCLSFIKYEDYTNQVEWAKVSQAIHETVDNAVIKPLNVESLKGKHISFLGCFSVSGEKEILITPVKAEAK